MSLFSLNNTASPSPAFTVSPATAAPGTSAPETNISVIMTLDAQLGISPITTASSGCSHMPRDMKSANISSPPARNIIVPSTKLTANTNAVMTSV